MAWLLIPADDRAAARKLAQRIDQILGYPRDLAESELRRIGPTPPGGWAACRTETAPLIMVHDDTGAAQLHGAIALQTDAIVEAMADARSFDVDGSKRRLRAIIADRGWVLRAELPGQPEAWSAVAARDGAEGSADGVPIPEGEE